MAAESNPVRRLRRLLAPVLAPALAAAAILAVAAIPAGSASATAPWAHASMASMAAADPEGGVHVSIAPAESTTFTTTGPQDVIVEIANGTAEPLAVGALHLLAADEAIDDPAEVDAWVSLGAGSTDDTPSSTEVGVAETRSVIAGSASTVRLTVPAGTFDAEAPLVGLAAQLEIDGELVSTGAGVFASPTAPATAPVGLALAAPLTVPAQSTGLLPAERLETWTGPSGLLTRQLDALDGRPVAIGLDPRIVASIRVLGSAAPASAVAWLERLDALPNEVFPLAYADADLAVQAQLGVDEPLEPLGFDDAIDPAAFVATPGDAGEGSTATPMPEVVPDTETVLEWPYTRADLAWPADDTVAADNLAWLADAGLTTTILAPSNVEPADGLVGAASTIGGSTAVVADARVTEPLRRAAAATSDTEWRAATARVAAELALAAGSVDLDESPVALLATFARSGGGGAERMRTIVDALADLPWATPASLTDAIGAPPTPRTLIDQPEDDQRRSNVDRMLQSERAVDEFSAVIDDPSVLTAPTRRELLALLDVGWIPQATEWGEAVGQWLIENRAVSDSVSVVPSSSVLIVASESGIPITVQNALPTAATVVVEVAPTNGRLIVEDEVEVTVEPESRSTVLVPVAAGVGNGEVTLEVSLAATDGTPVGDTVSIPANVRADWEGLGASVLAAIAVIVFGVGIWRNIRRRRRQRAEAAAADETAAPAEPDAADEPDAAAEAPVRAAVPSEADQAPVPATTHEAVPDPAPTPSTDRPLEDPRDG